MVHFGNNIYMTKTNLRLDTRDQGRDALYIDWLLVTLTKERPLRLPTKWDKLNCTQK